MHLPKEFGCTSAGEAFTTLFAQGMWRRCLRCAGLAPTFECKFCETSYDSSQFDPIQMMNHLAKKQATPLRCKRCMVCTNCQKVQDDSRYFSKQEKGRICKECELIPCKRCGLKKRHFFTAEDINHSQRKTPQAVVCSECKENLKEHKLLRP